MDRFKGTCQEFGKVFSQDLASFEEIDDKIQHHAEALTNCLKLVQSNPDSPSVQTLWMWLIRSAVKFLLWIDSPPSKTCLQMFLDTVKPWLIDEKFSGLCSHELLDMYNLAAKGPWTNPVLQKLLFGAGANIDELHTVFDDGLEFIEYHMRNLLVASRINEFILFGKAALSHKQVQKNVLVQRVYQEHADMIKEEELLKQMSYFDLEVTISLLDESIKANINCERLCVAAIKYLVENKEMRYLEEIFSCWINMVRSKHQGSDLFDYLRAHTIESKIVPLSVQQLVVFVRALWKVIPDSSRMLCVEILYHALQILSSDEQDSEELKKGILSSIAYFLPNSRVARSCILTIFVLNPTVNNYFQVAKIYKATYDRDKDIAADCKAHLRLSLLEYLQQHLSEQFLESSSWDWPLLRTACQSMLSSEDLVTAQMVEEEENVKEDNNFESSFSDATSTSNFDMLSDSKCSYQTTTDSETFDTTSSGSADACNCEACKIKLQRALERAQNKQEAAKLQFSNSNLHLKKVKTSRKKAVEEIYTCPEEKCQREMRSKHSMSRHLSKIHRWTLSEIYGFYKAVAKPKPPSKSKAAGGFTTDTANNKISTDEQKVDAALSKDGEKSLAAHHQIKKDDAAAHSSDFNAANRGSPNNPSTFGLASNVVSVHTFSDSDIEPQVQILFPANALADMSITAVAQVPDLAFDNAENISDALTAANPSQSSNFHKDAESIQIENDISISSSNHFQSSFIKPAKPIPTLQKTSNDSFSLKSELVSTVSSASPLGKDVTSLEGEVMAISPGLDPVAVPSLQPIFPLEGEVKETSPEPEPDTNLAKDRDLLIACPVKYCSRSFKHRHTVQEHIEFRHKVSSEKARKMAQSAEYVDAEKEDQMEFAEGAPEKIFSSDITRCRAWYWPVDEFIIREIEGKVTRYNENIDSNFRFSLECDVIYTLGRVPQSFDHKKAESHIVSKWKFAENRAKSSVKKDDEKKQVQVSSEPMPVVRRTPHSVEMVKTNKYLVKKRNVVQPSGAKPKRSKEPTFSEPSTVDDDIQSATSTEANFSHDKSCQINFKVGTDFCKRDHFHNLPEVRSKRLKKSKRNENPIAITILSGIFVKQETRTFASQCCQEDIKQYSIVASKSSAPSKKRKNSSDVFAKPLFSTSGEEVAPPPSKQVKRKYDVQTVYHFADKYTDIPPDPVVGSPPATSSLAKPSFADALNSFGSVQTHEKPKLKKKSSKGIEQSFNVGDSRELSSVVSSVTLPIKSHRDSRSAAPAKKAKLKKTKNSRSLSTSGLKKHDNPGSVTRKKSDDFLSRPLFPSHDYEELLKKAEQLSSSTKSKVTKVSKPLIPTLNPSSKASSVSNPNTSSNRVTSLIPNSSNKTTSASNPNLSSNKATPTLNSSAPSRKETSTLNFNTQSTPVAISTAGASSLKTTKSRSLSTDNLSTLNVTKESASTSSTPSPKTPVDEETVQNKSPKSAVVKRRIDLRKLSYSAKNTISSSSLRKRPSSSREESCSTSEDFVELPTSTFTDATETIVLPHAVPVARNSEEDATSVLAKPAEVKCPECSKPMVSAFALTCHMRKRHKVKSKMFFPDQNANLSSNSSSSSTYTGKAKKPKNVKGPPEGSEACSSAASFKVARNKLNASDSEESIDTDLEPNLSTTDYTPNPMELSERDFSSEYSSDAKQTTLRAYGEDKNNRESDDSYVDNSSTCLPKQLQPDTLEQQKSSTGMLVKMSMPDGILAVSAVKRFAARSLRSNTDVEKTSDDNDSFFDFPLHHSHFTSSDEPCTSQKTLSLADIVRKGSFYYCPITNCKSTCKLLKSIKTHIKKRHPELFTQIWSSLPNSKASTNSNFKQSKPAHAKVASQQSKGSKTPGTIVRRSAYTEASIQIQLSSFHFSPRKWGQENELVRLYNKRMRRKVAQALLPAGRKSKSKSRKRLRKVSNESTDSFEADYDPQLPCWYCDEMFHCRKNLTLHIQHHIRNIDLCNFRCMYIGCLYGFRTFQELKHHMSIHDCRRHICLFCPNQSRYFKSLHQLVLHEAQAHYHLQINMFQIRKTMCITAPVRLKRIPKPVPISDSSSSEEESFLALGHRRTDICLACESNQLKEKPSVASYKCEIVSQCVSFIVDGMLCAIEEYHLILETASNMKSVSNSSFSTSHQESLEESLVADVETNLATNKTIEKELAIAVNVKKEFKTNKNVGKKTFQSEVCANGFQEQQDKKLMFGENSINVGHDSENVGAFNIPAADNTQNIAMDICNSANVCTTLSPKSIIIDENQINSPIVSTPSKQCSQASGTVSAEVSVLPFSDKSFCNPPVNVPEQTIKQIEFRAGETTPENGFDYDVALEVVHVVHKLVCDIEIEEQANYLRMCGCVPTGVMYYKQSDLCESSGVALSVYGYNSAAFLTLDMASGFTSANDLQETKAKEMTEVSHCAVSELNSQNLPNSSLKSQSDCSSSCVLDLSTSRVSSTTAESYAHNFSHSSYQMMLQIKLLFGYARSCHPTWTLEADTNYSDLCDISHLDLVSKQLFSQHYVVPNPQLGLPQPPLSGIFSSYPVMSDIHRFKAYTHWKDGAQESFEEVSDEQISTEIDQTSLPAINCQRFPDLLRKQCTSEPCSMLADTSTMSAEVHNADKSKLVPCAATCDSPRCNKNEADISMSVANDLKPKQTEQRDAKFEIPNAENLVGSASSESRGANFCVVTGASAESRFCEDFLNELRIEKAKKYKKSAMLKPSNVFKGRGRHQKSIDLRSSSSQLRRSLKEIVAFCDVPELREQLLQPPQLPLPKRSCNLKKKRRISESAELSLVSNKMNPVVSIESLDSKFTMRKSADDGLNTSHPSIGVVKLKELVESDRNLTSHDAVSSAKATSDENSEPEKERADNFTSSEDDVPLKLWKVLHSSHFTSDHTYALPYGSEREVNSPSQEIPINEVEVVDYCEEVLIDEALVNQDEIKIEAEDCQNVVSCLSTDHIKKQPDPNTETNAVKKSRSTSNQSGANKRGELVPCIFCRAKFSSKPKCKEHFKKVHFDINVAARNGGKTAYKIRKTNAQGKGLKLGSSSRRRVSKKDLVEGLKKYIIERNITKSVFLQLKSGSKSVVSSGRSAIKRLIEEKRKENLPQFSTAVGSKPASAINKTVFSSILCKQACDVKSTSSNFLSPTATTTEMTQNSPSAVVTTAEQCSIVPNTPISTILSESVIFNEVNAEPMLSSSSVLKEANASSTVSTPVQSPAASFNMVPNQTTSTWSEIANNAIILNCNSSAVGVESQLSSSNRNMHDTHLPAPTPKSISNLVHQMPGAVSKTLTCKVQSTPDPVQYGLSVPISMHQQPVTKSYAIVTPTFRYDACSNAIFSSNVQTGQNRIVRSLSNYSLVGSTLLAQNVPQPNNVGHLPANLQNYVYQQNSRPLTRLTVPITIRAPISTFVPSATPLPPAVTPSTNLALSVSRQYSIPVVHGVENNSPVIVSFTPPLGNQSLHQGQAIRSQKTSLQQKFLSIAAKAPCQPCVANINLSNGRDQGPNAIHVTKKSMPHAVAPGILQQLAGVGVAPSALAGSSVNNDSTANDADRTEQDINSSENSIQAQPSVPIMQVVLCSENPALVSSSTAIATISTANKSIDASSENFLVKQTSASEAQSNSPKLTTSTNTPKSSEFRDAGYMIPRRFEDMGAHQLTKIIYRCEFCDHMFQKRHDYMMHLLLVHQLLHCPAKLCSDIFGTKQDMEEHYRRKHCRHSSSQNSTSRRLSIKPTLATIDLTQSDSDKDTTDDETQDDEPEWESSCADEVWSAEVSNQTKKFWHSKLLSQMHNLSGDEFTWMLFFEVREFAKQSPVRVDDCDQSFMLCPISRCCVYGDKRLFLYKHMLDKHSCGQITKWVRKRETMLKKRQLREANAFKIAAMRIQNKIKLAAIRDKNAAKGALMRRRTAVSTSPRKKLAKLKNPKKSKRQELWTFHSEPQNDAKENESNSSYKQSGTSPAIKLYKCRFAGCGRTIRCTRHLRKRINSEELNRSCSEFLTPPRRLSSYDDGEENAAHPHMMICRLRRNACI